jgi:hypothetical protein
VNRAGHFPAAPCARPGIRGRHPACVSACKPVVTITRSAPRAPHHDSRRPAVVTTAAWVSRVPATQGCRAGGACASATRRGAGNRVKRGFHGEFRPRVPDVVNQLRQFEPRDGWAAKQLLLAARRESASGSRFPACSAGADRNGRRAWPASRRRTLIRYVGS